MSERTWWWRIGGPNAITVWSWWATLPLALLASVYGGVLAGLPLLGWTLAALGVNVVLIVPLVVARATYLSARPRSSRPWLAVLTFALVGALRSVLMVGVAAALGYADVGAILWEWPLMGAIGAVFALSVVAVVVDSVREHRAATKRLRALQESLRQINEIESARLADMEAEFIRDVEERVLVALEQVRSSEPTSGSEAGHSLREVAEAVVRPLSHHLATAEPWAPPEPVTPREGWWCRLRELLRLIQPVHPLGPVLIFEASLLPFMLASFGAAPALVNLGLGSVLLIGIGLLIRRVRPGQVPPWLNVVGLTLAYAASFAVAGTVVSGVFIALGYGALPFWSGVIIYPMLALAWALLEAVLARRVELEENLADSLLQEAQAAERLRQRVASMQQRIAKVLHSVVQGELVTSAVSLSRIDDRGAVAGELDRLSATIVQRLRTEESPASSRERILDLLALWSAALDIDVEVDKPVWAALDTDSSLLERVIDVLAEGLTNAVRHGSGPRIHVRMHRGATGIEVSIESPGRLEKAAVPGLGTRSIAAAAQSWSLDERSGAVHLSATIAT